jgi:dipeptidyl aminopeptidase/acylaminoacyl peptidase
MVFQGTQDQWTPVELAQRLAADWRGAGGTVDLMLLEGERHTFLTEHPFTPNAVKTVKAMVEFIKQYGAERHAAR